METLELEEHQRHVIEGPAHRSALCGVPILFGEPVFQNVEQARAAVTLGTSFQPCPRCWARVEAMTRG